MSKMLGKSGHISYRPKCGCCQLSESNMHDKTTGRRIKKAREKANWKILVKRDSFE